MTVDLAKMQPLPTFFNIELGGLSNTYHYPEIPVKIEIDIDAVPKIVFTFLDQTGLDVEPHLWSGGDIKQGTLVNDGTFRFGYSNGDDSGDIPFQIDHYEVEKDDNSYDLVLYAQYSNGPLRSCNQINGTAQEILDRFCQIHDYDLVIHPEFAPDKQMEVGKLDKDSTEKRELTHTKLQNETDWSYIQRIVQYCADADGRSGYHAWQAVENGRKVLHVELPPEGSSQYEYTTNGPETTVVKWRPKISFQKSMLGAHDIHWNSHQPISGDDQKFNMNQELFSDRVVTNNYELKPLMTSNPRKDKPTVLIQAGGAETFEEPSVQGAMRMRNPGSPSPYAGFNAALTGTYQAMIGCNGGDLLILGDPKIEYMKSVQINDFYPSTYGNPEGGRRKHYSSGLYMIKHIRHTIINGEFLTLLSLQRQAPGDVGGKN